MNKFKILFLEDNEIIREGIKEYLEENNFIVDSISSIKFFKKANLDDIDLFLLDVNLPDGNAFSIVEDIKKLNRPIIFLTIRDSEQDILHGFDIGADDYVVKPFKPAILKARINSALKRYIVTKKLKYNIDGMKLDVKGTCLYIEDEKINLTQKEFILMKYFFENIGRTLTRDFLIQILWDQYNEFVNDNTLSVMIRRLREKIIPYDGYIKTVRGIGYKLENEK